MNGLRHSAIAFVLAGALTVVSAQTVTNTKVSRTFTVPKASVLNTRALAPQVDNRVRQMPERPENPLTFKWGQPDPNNRLVPGLVTTKTRISGPEQAFPGIDATGWTPPDCDLGVGPNHIVAVVNSSVAFFNKSTGQQTFLRTIEDFFAGTGVTSFVFDPKAFYDPLSRRFFVISCELEQSTSTSKMVLAVSDDSDPNGTWFRYRVESKLTTGGSDFWLDYPGFGTSRDYVGFCGNMFGFTSGWAGNMFVVLPKAQLLTGAPVTASVIHDPSSASVKLAQSSDTPSLFAVSVDAGDRLKVQSVTNTGATATTVLVPPSRPPQSSVPGPSGHNMDALDGRLYNANWKNGSLVTTHGVMPVGATRFVNRWYDVNLNGFPATGRMPFLTQSGEVSAGTTFAYHMPAIAKNRRNDIAMIFSRSSATVQADIMVTGRKSTDALGTMGAPVRLLSSAGLYGGVGVNRWGDYFGMVVDPVDDLTFWGIGMVSRADGNWQTHVFKFTVSNYSDFLVPTPVTAVSTLAGQGTLGTEPRSNLNTADSKFVTVKSSNVKGLGQVTSLRTEYQTTVRPGTVGALRLNFTNNSPTGSSTFLYLWNNRTSAWDQLSVAPNVTYIDRIEAAADAYVSSTGKVIALLRVVQPPLRPGQYTLAQDQLGLSVAPRS
jgi:hypothetical protein